MNARIAAFPSTGLVRAAAPVAQFCGADTMAATPSGFSAWHEAHELASRAEHAVFFAAIAYARSAGPKPSQEDFRHAKALRAEADSLFKATLEGISRKADALRQVNACRSKDVRIEIGRSKGG